ncbi:hypothetical protein JW992_02510 [candidate division KSB1 bacterium]|nr:hypothetical protein [candidate division KSB1 bacterium]
MLISSLQIAAGLLILYLGAEALVRSGTSLAVRLNISPLVIGLTLVAGGTSLPELATSIVAALRKNPEIALGNIIGSNIFNILCVMGTASFVSPLQCQGIHWLDLGMMLAFSLLLLPLMRSEYRLHRGEGLLLLLCYGIYLAILF